MLVYPSRKKRKGVPDPTPEMVAERERIARHEAFFAALPDGDAKTALVNAMLQRAYDLLWDGDAEACDAIIEWMPAMEARQMLDAWSEDQDIEYTPESRAKVAMVLQRARRHRRRPHPRSRQEGDGR